MSASTSLIVKYRPTGLADFIGQDAIIPSVVAVLEKRNAQAFLIDGPSGCGKTSLARVCATMLGAVELVEVDAATYASVEDVRQLTTALQYRPLTGTVRAFIIDECQRLSKQAWDALLKSIEEPPSWVTWFFCTTDPARVPDTIKTRCVRFGVKSVPWQVLYEQLVAPVAAAEEFAAAAADPVLRLCAKEAGGSPRQALSNLALCASLTNAMQAADALASASESPEAVELARALVKRPSWREIQSIINKLTDYEPESIRRVVVNYVAKAVLAADSDKTAVAGLSILAAFNSPFYAGEGMAPVLLACGRLYHAKDS